MLQCIDVFLHLDWWEDEKIWNVSFFSSFIGTNWDSYNPEAEYPSLACFICESIHLAIFIKVVFALFALSKQHLMMSQKFVFNSRPPVDDFEFRTEQFLPVSTRPHHRCLLFLCIYSGAASLKTSLHFSTSSPYSGCSSSCCSRWRSATLKCRCSTSSRVSSRESTSRWAFFWMTWGQTLLFH